MIATDDQSADTLEETPGFETLAKAISAGYQIYDRQPDGTFMVRMRTVQGWTMALVRPTSI